MKNNKIKNILVCTILLSFLLIVLVSCSTNEQTKSPNDTSVPQKGMDYSIISADKECYIVFDNISKYDNNSNQLAGISFNNIKEMKDAITKGLLTDDQKQTIVSAFPKNDKNEILCCDFNNLFTPTVPSTVSVLEVYWSGTSYSYELELENNVSGSVSIYSEDIYDRELNEFNELFSQDNITVTKTECLDDSKTVTYYKTNVAELKSIRYSMSDNERTIMVDKEYCLKHYDSLLPESDSIPMRVTLYCSEKNVQYIIKIYEPDFDPADSWLLEFGLTKYIESDVVIK